MKKWVAVVFVLSLLLVSCQPDAETRTVPSVPAVIETTPEPLVVQTPEPLPVVAAPKPSPKHSPEVIVKPSPEPLSQAPPASTSRTIEIAIENMAFSQEDVTIKAGDTVVWKQKDPTSHTVTVTQGPAPDKFDSNLLRQGQTFSHTFTIPGTYYYKCSLHTKMRGKIVVE